MISQKARILRELRDGPVRATAFSLPNVVDDLAPIYRVAARINELRDAGYVIDTTVPPLGSAVYTLISEPNLACDDRYAPSLLGGPTDPGNAASGREAAGGNHLAHAASPILPPGAGEQQVVRDPLVSRHREHGHQHRCPPSGGAGGQLFDHGNDAPTRPRPHWQQEA